MQTNPHPLSGRLVYSIPQAAHALGVGQTSVWKLIREQKIRAIRLGLRRTGITVEEIERVRAHGISR